MTWGDSTKDKIDPQEGIYVNNLHMRIGTKSSIKCMS